MLLSRLLEIPVLEHINASDVSRYLGIASSPEYLGSCRDSSLPAWFYKIQLISFPFRMIMHSNFAPQQGLLNLDWMKQNLGNVPTDKRYTQGRNNSNGVWKTVQLFIGRLPLSLGRRESGHQMVQVAMFQCWQLGIAHVPSPRRLWAFLPVYFSSLPPLVFAHLVTDQPSFPSSAATGTLLCLKTRVKKMQLPPPK